MEVCSSSKPNPILSLLNEEEADPSCIDWHPTFSDTELSSGDVTPELRSSSDIAIPISTNQIRKHSSISLSNDHSSEFPASAKEGKKSKSSSGLCRRKRLGYHQWLQMERFFKVTPHPSKQLRQNLAKSLNLTPHQVQVWFQNRRVKKKHEVSARPLPYVQPSIYMQPNQLVPSSVPLGLAPNSLVTVPLPKRLSYPQALHAVYSSTSQGHLPSYNNPSEVAVAEQLLSFHDIHEQKPTPFDTLKKDNNQTFVRPQSSYPTVPKGLSYSDPSALHLPFVTANGNSVLPPPWK